MFSSARFRRLKLISTVKMRKSVILLMSVLALTSTFFSLELVFEERNQIANGYGDFIIFYTGAQILRDGLGPDLYDLSVQKLYQSKFNVPIRLGPLPYNHPPFELLWHVPLTYLPYVSAYLVWTAINVIFLGILYRLFGLQENKDVVYMFFFMVLGFYPVTVALLHGQDSILLCLLLTGAFIMLKERKETVAGMFVALALIKPQFAVPAMTVLFVRPYSSAVKAFLITGSILLVVSMLMVGSGGAQKYLYLLETTDRLNYTIAPQNMPNIRGLVYSVFHEGNPRLVLPMVMLLTLGILGLVFTCWRKISWHAEQSFELRLALTITLTLLASYHCYVHDLSLLLVPAVLIAKSLLKQTSKWSINQWLLIGALLTLWVPFPLTYGPLLSNERFAWGGLFLIAFAILLSVELKRTSQAAIAGETFHE